MQPAPNIFSSASAISTALVQYWFLAPIIMLALFVADVLLTYFDTRNLAARYGLPLAAALEVNDRIRNSWLKHGLKKGEIRILLLLSPVVLILLGFSAAMWIEFPILFGFMAGIYASIVQRHVVFRRSIQQLHPCPICQTIHRPSPYLPKND